MAIEVNLGLGFVAGIVWAGIGYAVAKVKTGEDFSGKNFTTSVVIGIILSIIASFTGQDMTKIGDYTTVQTLTIVIDKIVGVAQKHKTTSTGG